MKHALSSIRLGIFSFLAVLAAGFAYDTAFASHMWVLAIVLIIGVMVLLQRENFQRGIPHMNNASRIVPVLAGDAAKCKWISDLLLDNCGIYVQPINYLPVRKQTERLRVMPTSFHPDTDIDYLVSSLLPLWARWARARVAA